MFGSIFYICDKKKISHLWHNPFIFIYMYILIKNRCMLDLPGTTFTKNDLPRVKDMDKAFHKADEDGSGVVDFKEFIKLYGQIKSGEVDGLAGYGLFEWKRKKTPKNKVRPVR